MKVCPQSKAMLTAPCSSGKLQGMAYREGMGQKNLLNLADRVGDGQLSAAGTYDEISAQSGKAGSE